MYSCTAYNQSKWPNCLSKLSPFFNNFFLQSEILSPSSELKLRHRHPQFPAHPFRRPPPESDTVFRVPKLCDFGRFHKSPKIETSSYLQFKGHGSRSRKNCTRFARFSISHVKHSRKWFGPSHAVDSHRTLRNGHQSRIIGRRC